MCLCQINSFSEWYNEIWNIAINDKFRCDVKLKKGLLNTNIFNDIWGDLVQFVLINALIMHLLIQKSYSF